MGAPGSYYAGALDDRKPLTSCLLIDHARMRSLGKGIRQDVQDEVRLHVDQHESTSPQRITHFERESRQLDEELRPVGGAEDRWKRFVDREDRFARQRLVQRSRGPGDPEEQRTIDAAPDD